MSEIIQGRWDDLIARRDPRGRHVRVIVLDEERSVDPWLQGLQAWVEGHKPQTGPVDDSRNSIYGGAVNDPR